VKLREQKTMSRKIFVWLLATVLLGTVSAHAQQLGKVYRIGRLSGAFSSSTFSLDALRRELRELGYVEGKNIVFELRSAEEKPERLPALANELVRLKVDVIVAGGPNDARTANNATKTIPIVFTDSPEDPVARGLVDSLARPGGNVTGFYSMADVLAGKRLEVLKESFPKLSRVAVLLYPMGRSSKAQWTKSQFAARQLGLQLYSMEVSSADQFDSAFKEAAKTGSAALAVTRHRFFNTATQKRIIELAGKYRLPAIYYREDFVEQGGLMSYGADEVEPFERVAAMIDKILKGAKPGDIPVEQSSKFEFVVNLKVAKALNLTIPPNVLARAQKVIQ
jgi:putative ABC transport system substrate-binding protein